MQISDPVQWLSMGFFLAGVSLKTARVMRITVRDGAAAMFSANGLVGTEFASRYRLQPTSGFQRPEW